MRIKLEKAEHNESQAREVERLKVLLEESEKIIQSEKIRYETKFIDMELKVVEFRDRVV